MSIDPALYMKESCVRHLNRGKYVITNISACSAISKEARAISNSDNNGVPLSWHDWEVVILRLR